MLETTEKATHSPEPPEMVSLWLDGLQYGLSEPVEVMIPECDKERIDKILAASNPSLAFCDRCGQLHKSVREVVVQKGNMYGEPEDCYPATVEDLCTECHWPDPGDIVQ